jgi:ABC-type phosphate/phosphonate transport system substrate-binding protein
MAGRAATAILSPAGKSSPVAALPMYDWPEIRAATDAFWRAVRGAAARRGLGLPATLDRARAPFDLWADPALVLGQTCGLPFVTRLRGKVRLLATPCYAATGCDGPRYASMIVVAKNSRYRRLEDLRGARAAYNATHSQSGYAAFRAIIAPLAGGRPFFAGTIETGSHRASLRAVAEGRADICAIDAVCWALAARHDAAIANCLRVIGQTPMTPGLPLICALSRTDGEVAALRQALAEAIAEGIDPATRSALMLTGLEVLPEHDYDVIGAMADGTHALGYELLH